MKVFDIDTNMKPEMWQSHWEDLRERKSFTIESEHFNKDGHHFPVEVSVNHIQTQDKEFNCAYVVDITEREKHERELAQALENEKKANQAKSTFLANMSHEIRTPMTAILGYTNMLCKPKQSDEERSEWAKQTQRNAQHLLSLINDVLDLSKIEAGQLTITPEQCNFMEIVDDVNMMMQPLAYEKMLQYIINIDPGIPTHITTDPTRLRQILINIINNAVKYTDYGKITLNISHAQKQDDHIKIEVRDTGIGMNVEQIENIFNPFTQVHDTKQINPGGAGLGLTICKKLAKLMHGRLMVDCPEEGGSTFTLYLPIGANLQQPLSREQNTEHKIEYYNPANYEQALNELKGKHVLIVDDNPDNQRIINFLLDEYDMLATTASNGEEAIDIVNRLADSLSFDLILMDIQMPVMDGYTATKHLRELGYDMPIIALTAHAMTEDRDRCEQVGCNDYLSKPIVPEQFYKHLIIQLSQHHVTDKKASKPISQVAENSITALKSNLADNPKFAPLLASFIVSLKENQALLMDHLEKENTDELRRLVHRIRGTAGNYGYPDISKCAAVCEDGLLAADLDAVEDEAKKLISMIGQAITTYELEH